MKTKLSMLHLLFVLMAVFSLYACQDSNTDRDFSSINSGQDVRKVIKDGSNEKSAQYLAKRIDEGVLLEVSAKGNVYKPGELIVVNVKVENLAEDPISYTMMNIGDPAIYVRLLETPYSSGKELFESDYQPRMVNPSVTSEILEPGQVITREVVWDQKLPTYPEAIQAPNGLYSIQVNFLIGEESREEELRESRITLTFGVGSKRPSWVGSRISL